MISIAISTLFEPIRTGTPLELLITLLIGSLDINEIFTLSLPTNIATVEKIQPHCWC